MDGHPLHRTAHVLYFRASRASFVWIDREIRRISINLTTSALAKATDWCGVKSGRDFDKFKECGLKALPGVAVKAPVLAQSPLTLECKVRQCLPLGSHHTFVAAIVNVLADKKYLDKENGKFDLEKAGLLVYAHGFYFKTLRLYRPFRFFGAQERNTQKIAPKPISNGRAPKRGAGSGLRSAQHTKPYLPRV